jgi:hypothetical protein
MSSKSKNFIGALFILLVLALGAYVFWHTIPVMLVICLFVARQNR